MNANTAASFKRIQIQLQATSCKLQASSFKRIQQLQASSCKLQANTNTAASEMQAKAESEYKYSRKAKDENLKQIQRQGTRLGGGSGNMLTPFHFDILHFTFNIQHSIFPLSPFQL